MAVSPHILTKVTNTGSVGVGGVSVPGVEPGDIVFAIYKAGVNSSNQTFISSFETIITVAGQIQQIDTTDLSAVNFVFLICPFNYAQYAL